VQPDYERLYEEWAAAAVADADIVGAGDFIGDVEVAVLYKCGLKPDHTLVDFGCGTGRLAIKLIPTLAGGHYVGIEIARNILDRAERNIAEACPEPPCEVTWIHNGDRRTFPLAADSVDMICAFSVFTHMEHEDSYAYLVDARRVIRPSGRFVFSCLPLELAYAQDVFRESAAPEVADRWAVVRNVVTSRDLMDEIARLAGWKTERWYRGDREKYRIAGGRRELLHQSVCVLKPA
jgi:cyclopropane fatty-acyl-phospholipid synthase-like methyltransferase